MTQVTTNIALSSQDITLAQSALRLLDARFGGKARAALLILLSVLTAATAILQQISTVLDGLPKWQWVGAVGLFCQSVITLIGRFTPAFTNVLDAPPVKDAPEPEVIDLPAQPEAPVEPAVVIDPAPVVQLPPPPPLEAVGLPAYKPVPVAQPIE